MNPARASVIEPDESADLVVCGRAIPAERLPSIFADNIYGGCADCGTEIMWRPYVPDAPKICFNCAVKRVEASGNTAQCVTTRRAIGEAILITARPEGRC